MKVARFVLKIVSASLALAAIVCCVIAYWDKLAACFTRINDKLEERKCRNAEYADYADLDEVE